MGTPRWEVKIGSPVIAIDGEYGRLQELIVSPEEERVVALLVQGQGLIGAHMIVVPAEAVANATDSEVHLNISRQQADALPKYEPESALIVAGQKYRADDQLFAVRGSQGVEVGRLSKVEQAGTAEVKLPTSVNEQLVLGVRAGQQVFCEDGHAGKVSMLLTDPRGQVKGFVLEAGFLPRHNLIVPTEWVRQVESETIHLSVEKKELERLPDYGPDEALAAEIDEALWHDEILRDTDYKSIGVTVQDGIVRLRGHVATTMNKKRAEGAVGSVAGVLGVENQLVVDVQLVNDVAQALAGNELTRHEQVLVGAQHGVIVLNGQVGSVGTRVTAEAVAASIPHVRAVVNYLQVPGMWIDPEEQQVWQPWVGRDVYASDMLLGRIEQVIINPRNRRVTAFVTDGYFADADYSGEHASPDRTSLQERRVIIPVHAMRYETSSSTHLKISSGEAARNFDFDPANFVSPPADWQPPYPYRPDDVLFAREG